MSEEQLKQWAEEEIKSKHKISKIDPFKRALTALCDAARVHGEMPVWMLKGALNSASGEYDYK
jgi:hypothetical protein